MTNNSSSIPHFLADIFEEGIRNGDFIFDLFLYFLRDNPFPFSIENSEELHKILATFLHCGFKLEKNIFKILFIGKSLAGLDLAFLHEGLIANSFENPIELIILDRGPVDPGPLLDNMLNFLLVEIDSQSG